MSSTVATLSGSCGGVTGTVVEAGFKYGLSSGSLSSSKTGTYSNGSISAGLSGLTVGTTYYYKAYVTVQGTGDKAGTRTTFYGGVQSFTTKESLVPTGWLELPAAQSASNLINGNFGTGKSRNYSYCYDTGWFAPRWEAYPLTAAHLSGDGDTDSWRYNPDPNIGNSRQISHGGYGTNYGHGEYARGHLVPNADRKIDKTMNLPTYYSTNQVPMIQNGFNSGIWSSLESGVRSVVNNMTDTVYVAVGPCYKTVGGNETVTYLTAIVDGVHPQELPVPNYCWKALLKVKRNGNEITNACAVAVWLPHKQYEGDSYSNHAISIDELEAKTGIDFFANLPNSVEAVAEKNSSWDTFKNF